MIKGNNQGGSLLSYILIGIALVLVLAGGLYGVQRYNASREATEIAQEEANNEEDAAQPQQTDGSESSNKQSEANSDDVSPRDRQPDTNNTTNEKNTASTDDSKHKGTDKLPETGPADTLMSLIAVAALAFAGSSYVRSRRLS